MRCDSFGSEDADRRPINASADASGSSEPTKRGRVPEPVCPQAVGTVHGASVVDRGRRRGNDRLMNDGDVASLTVAVAALNGRDLEPFVGLMSEDMIWTAQAPRWLWWRPAPG